MVDDFDITCMILGSFVTPTWLVVSSKRKAVNSSKTLIRRWIKKVGYQSTQ